MVHLCRSVCGVVQEGCGARGVWCHRGVVPQGYGATGVWCHRGVVPPREQRLASTLSTLLRQAGMSCVSVSTTKSYILLWPGFGSYFLKVNASKLQGTGNECTHTHNSRWTYAGVEGSQFGKAGSIGSHVSPVSLSGPVGQSVPSMGSRDIDALAV